MRMRMRKRSLRILKDGLVMQMNVTRHLALRAGVMRVCARAYVCLNVETHTYARALGTRKRKRSLHLMLSLL